MACTTSYSRVCSLPSPPRLLSPMLKKIFKRRTTKTYYPKLITNRDFIWCELVCSYKHGVALMTHLYWLLAQMFVGSHFRSSLCFRSWVDVNCGSIKAWWLNNVGSWLRVTIHHWMVISSWKRLLLSFLINYSRLVSNFPLTKTNKKKKLHWWLLILDISNYIWVKVIKKN